MSRRTHNLKLQKAAARTRRRLRLAALCVLPTCAVLAVGAPLSQLVRLVEIDSTTASSNPQKSYRLVLPSELDELARSAAKSADAAKQSGKESQKQKAPRLLKPVADQWERVSRVEINGAEIPAQILPPAFTESGLNAIPEIVEVLYLTHSPPGPPTTGPPNQS